MPKIVDAVQYRRELLSKCFDLFAEKGYANVTTRQIAKELGVSTGTLYHYFPNKQVLFEQLAEQVSLQDVEILQKVDKDRDISQRIIDLGQLLIDHQDYIIKQAAIWLDFRQHCSAREVSDNVVFQQIDLRYERAIAELLDLEDSQIASFIWASIDGIAIAQLDRQTNFVTQIELLTQMLIAYFEKHILT
ncbi:TetR/AcrR family transcriptional regulator [Pleurocapsales cyanobacterium LEGE 10410]|nr:TetR/AcrR family transcriptional regulator [Pleurocapsales cyanobacterium LEGE 10410]